MAELNCSVPGGHFYCYLRKEFLYNLKKHEGEFIPCAAYGIASVPGRALGFHVHLNNGASIARVPIHALVHDCGGTMRPDEAPPREKYPLDWLQLWDNFGVNVCAHSFDYLSESRAKVFLKKKTWLEGDYMFTIDWFDNGYSDAPDQHKNAHVVQLDNGLYSAQANNRILFDDVSFVEDRTIWDGEERPDYETNTLYWWSERERDQFEDGKFT